MSLTLQHGSSLNVLAGPDAFPCKTSYGGLRPVSMYRPPVRVLGSDGQNVTGTPVGNKRKSPWSRPQKVSNYRGR